MKIVLDTNVVVSGLLGYVAQDTTRLKTTAITGTAPATVTDQVKGVLKKVATKKG